MLLPATRFQKMKNTHKYCTHMVYLGWPKNRKFFSNEKPNNNPKIFKIRLSPDWPDHNLVIFCVFYFEPLNRNSFLIYFFFFIKIKRFFTFLATKYTLK